MRLVAVSRRADQIQARRPGSSRALFVQLPTGTTTTSEPPVEGESFDLEVTASWNVGPRRWLAGQLGRPRLDVPALGLEPLAVIELGRWDPRRDRMGAWPPAPPGQTEHEIERIPAGGSAHSGPEACLHRAIGLWAESRLTAARNELGQLLRQDLRCLAAHACLAFFAFDESPDRGGPARARRHYEVGLEIARLSVPDDFAGVLPWSRIGNRPYLRLLYGHAICLWRSGELHRARAELLRLCRLDPADQIAARVALDSIERGVR